MEPRKTLSSSESSKKIDPGNAKVIEWEDFEHELARLSSLSSVLNEAKKKKLALQQKLQPLIQVEAEALSRLNELEEMRKKLDNRKLVMEDVSMHSKLAKEDAKKQEESLSAEVRSLLVIGTALSVAKKRLQESHRLLYGDKGYVRLRNIQKKLRTRQQYMISQVSLLYPLKISVGPAEEQELELLPSTSKSGNSAGSKLLNPGSLTILGLHLTMLPFKTMSFFTDKKEVKKSATALGYVAHAVSLLASYITVHLRYPLRLGGSHSYIIDFAPSIEPSSDSSSTSLLSTGIKHMEFPLFLDGQDTTKAAYAVFLLNKDLEQLLTFIGVESLGPRHILGNLKEFQRVILSADYIDS